VAGGVTASGVVVPLEVTVRNQGDQPARDVTVELREDGGNRPGVRIDTIAGRPPSPSGSMLRSPRLAAIRSKPGSGPTPSLPTTPVMR